jgi:hypothetical protein
LLNIAPYTQLTAEDSTGKTVEKCTDNVAIRALFNEKQKTADFIDWWRYISTRDKNGAFQEQQTFYNDLCQLLNNQKWNDAITKMVKETKTWHLHSFMPGAKHQTLNMCRNILTVIGFDYENVKPITKDHISALQRLHTDIVKFREAHPEEFEKHAPRLRQPGLERLRAGASVHVGPLRTMPARCLTPPIGGEASAEDGKAVDPVALAAAAVNGHGGASAAAPAAAAFPPAANRP